MVFLSMSSLLSLILTIGLFLFVLGSMFIMDDKTIIKKDLLNSYECGFEDSESGSSFSIQYFLVGLSFMLFDLEICLFLPIMYTLTSTKWSVMLSMVFLLMVFLAYLYEFVLGALDWKF